MKPQRPVPAVIRMVLKDPKSNGEEFLHRSSTLLQHGLLQSEPERICRRCRLAFGWKLEP